jgi:hypothetical protein
MLHLTYIHVDGTIIKGCGYKLKTGSQTWWYTSVIPDTQKKERD